MVTELRFELNGESFSVSGKTLLDAGFTQVMHWSALSADESMPDLRINQHLPVNEVILKLPQFPLMQPQCSIFVCQSFGWELVEDPEIMP